MWAVWTAEGSDYLEKLDDVAFSGGGAWPVDPHNGLVDISHARWATGNAITAIDLCAGTIGQLFCPRRDGKEWDLRDFNQRQRKRKRRRYRLSLREWRQRQHRRDVARDVAQRRAALPPDFLRWVDATLDHQGYKDLLSARNSFTHSTLNRHLFSGRPGHVDRTQFPVRKAVRMSARDLVEKSKEVALDPVQAFIDVVDQY